MEENDNNKVEPMGIDELIKQLDKLPTGVNCFADGVVACMEFIKDNRTRLEAKKPQVLRFKKDIQEGGQGIKIIFYEYEFGECGKIRLCSKDRCTELAKSLGLQAEFIGEEK